MNRLDIINSTLRRMKQSALENLNDKSVRSLDIQSQYEETLDAMLAMRAWSFAEKEICLRPMNDRGDRTESAEPKFKRDIWGRYVYPLPSDFIRKSAANRNTDDFDVMSDGIHTSGPAELKMSYVFKLREERRLPAYFIKALKPMLCFDLNEKLGLGLSNANAFFQEAQMLVEEAGRIDSYNKRTQKLPKSDFELAHETGY